MGGNYFTSTFIRMARKGNGTHLTGDEEERELWFQEAEAKLKLCRWSRQLIHGGLSLEAARSRGMMVTHGGCWKGTQLDLFIGLCAAMGAQIHMSIVDNKNK
jgi:hypothetical protein